MYVPVHVLAQATEFIGQLSGEYSLLPPCVSQDITSDTRLSSKYCQAI